MGAKSRAYVRGRSKSSFRGESTKLFQVPDNLYIAGELEIFPSPKASLEEESSEFFFSLRAYVYRVVEESSEFFQVPKSL